MSLVYCPLNVELDDEKPRQKLKLLSPTTLFPGWTSLLHPQLLYLLPNGAGELGDLFSQQQLLFAALPAYNSSQLKCGPSPWDPVWEKTPSIDPSWATVPARKAVPAWDPLHGLWLLSGDRNHSQEQVLHMPQLPSATIHLLPNRVPRGLEHIHLLLHGQQGNLCSCAGSTSAISSHSTLVSTQVFSQPSWPHCCAVFCLFLYMSSQSCHRSRLTGSAASCSGFAVDD